MRLYGAIVIAALAALTAFAAYRRSRVRELAPAPGPATRSPGRAGFALPRDFGYHEAWDRRIGVGLLAILVAGWCVVLGWLVGQPGTVRVAILGAVLAAFAGLGAISARLLVPALIAWLAALGLVRRLVTEFVEPTTYDLLLLVAPSIIVVILVGTPAATRVLRESTLAKLVAALGILAVLAAFNPAGGSPLAGASSLMFVLVPILAFWVGTRIDDRILRGALILVAALSVVAATYGLVQSFSGFPSWDRRWIETSGYTALNVGRGHPPVRDVLLRVRIHRVPSIGVAVIVAGLLHRGRLLPVLRPSSCSSASRSSPPRPVERHLQVVAAIGLMVAARFRLSLGMRIATAIAIAVALVLLLPVVVSSLDPDPIDDPLIAHQVEGLADPNNADVSTLDIHMTILVEGVQSAFSNPLGSGLSDTTIAAEKFGGARGPGEGDPAVAAVGMGLPGLAVYLAIFALRNRPPLRARASAGRLPLTWRTGPADRHRPPVAQRWPVRGGSAPVAGPRLGRGNPPLRGDAAVDRPAGRP